MAGAKLCAVEGCGKVAICRGWCQMHYTRWQRHGDTDILKVGGKTPTLGCSVAGCERPHESRGLCLTHVARLRKHGKVTADWTEQGAPRDWLLDHVSHDEAHACLTWPYARNPDGTAAIRWSGRTIHACRVMCEAIHGPPDPADLETAHNCGKGHEGCINPHHLRWATHTQNMGDKIGHDTHNRGERHPMAKLTEDDVRAIRRLAATMSRTEIAPLFDISAPYVGEIIARKTWGWLA